MSILVKYYVYAVFFTMFTSNYIIANQNPSKENGNFYAYKHTFVTHIYIHEARF